MPVEVISEPFVGREDSKGGFGQRRLYVTVRKEDGTTERMLATEAVPKTPKGAKSKPEPVKPEQPEAENV